MKFKLGDFVRFVDEKREGYVTKVIDNQTLGVTDSDGFEIPVAVSNLTSVHGYGAAEEEDLPKPIVVNVPTINKTESGIYLAVATDEKVGNVVHFHLQNHSPNVLLVSLTTQRKDKYAGSFYGVIEAHQSALVYSASIPDLDIWPEFNFQFLMFSKADVKPVEPVVIKKKFRAKDFSTDQKELPQLKNKGWLIRLDEQVQVTIDAQKLKESFFKSPAEKKTVSAPEREIDLHIEKLRDDHHFLEADEMLQIQIAHFQHALDAAIVHHFDKIIFIHGTGNGTLRDKIHKLISKNPHIKTYMDARKEKFGYGATEVVFK
ncbi:Smr/MutS family protein [Pedobacter nototheniae]|uniref:Smr/MutS family protein n=1 Tax=Pedobacter nototheniae TaxID=2488994 RepID=UPI00292FE1EB|nr:Smr/MutS family protein [Pedobacter nototheniae]